MSAYPKEWEDRALGCFLGQVAGDSLGSCRHLRRIAGRGLRKRGRAAPVAGGGSYLSASGRTSRVARPRPACFWPVDIPELVPRLPGERP